MEEEIIISDDEIIDENNPIETDEITHDDSYEESEEIING